MRGCADAPADVGVALTAVVEFIDGAQRPVLRLDAWLSFFAHLPAGLRAALLLRSTRAGRAAAYTNVGLQREAQQFATPVCFADAVAAARLAAARSVDEGLATIAASGGARFAQGFSAVIPSVAEAQLLLESDHLLSDDFIGRSRRARDVAVSAGRALLLGIDRLWESALRERDLLVRLARKAGDGAAYERFRGDFFADVGAVRPGVGFDGARRCWEPDQQQDALAQFDTLPGGYARFEYDRALANLRVGREVRPYAVGSLAAASPRVRARYLSARANLPLVALRAALQHRHKEMALSGLAQCARADPQHRASFILQLVSFLLERRRAGAARLHRHGVLRRRRRPPHCRVRRARAGWLRRCRRGGPRASPPRAPLRGRSPVPAFGRQRRAQGPPAGARAGGG